MKVLVKGDEIIELIPTRDWHWHFDWRDLRIGVSFQSAMWEFNLPGFCVWCDRYTTHGQRLNEIPDGAEVLVHPDTRLNSLTRAGLQVELRPR